MLGKLLKPFRLGRRWWWAMVVGVAVVGVGAWLVLATTVPWWIVGAIVGGSAVVAAIGAVAAQLAKPKRTVRVGYTVKLREPMLPWGRISVTVILTVTFEEKGEVLREQHVEFKATVSRGTWEEVRTGLLSWYREALACVAADGASRVRLCAPSERELAATVSRALRHATDATAG